MGGGWDGRVGGDAGGSTVLCKEASGLDGLLRLCVRQTCVLRRSAPPFRMRSQTWKHALKGDH